MHGAVDYQQEKRRESRKGVTRIKKKGFAVEPFFFVFGFLHLFRSCSASAKRSFVKQPWKPVFDFLIIPAGRIAV